MILAVLLPAEPGSVPQPVPSPPPQLAEQLRDAGASEVRVDPGGDLAGQLRRLAELARGSAEQLLLCGTDLVAHTAALLTVLTEPGGGSVALTGDAAGAARDRYAAVREERGLVTAAGPVDGVAASGSFLGALRVGVPDLPALAVVAERLADQLESPTGASGPAAAPGPAAPTGPAAWRPATVVDLLLPALIGAGRRVAACRVRLLVADRVADEAEAAAVRSRMAAVDTDEARLRLAVKERDDFFTTYFVGPVAPRVTRWAARAGLSPTAVTGISVALALVAAAGFAWGTRPAMIAGAVLLYVSFVFDCVDGQLARYSRRFSAFGGWLDTMADRAKEYLVYAGLAIGAQRAGLDAVWPLALAALVLQTVRHMTDTWYGALHDEAVRRSPAAGGSGGIGGRLSRASERVQADTGSVMYWLKRIVVFPIGERWALIALTAALFDGRVALIAVLVWGGLAFAYTLALRSLRARTMRVPVLSLTDIARHRDDGPLARRLGSLARGRWPLLMAVVAAIMAASLIDAFALGDADRWAGPRVMTAAVIVLLLAGLPAGAPHDGPLDWLVPAALRATEYLFIVGASLLSGVPMPLLFALLFALALRHYDLTARMEKRAAAATARPWDLGWDGRVMILAIGVAAGVASAAVAAIAGYVVVMFSLGVIGAWVGTRAPARERASQGPR